MKHMATLSDLTFRKFIYSKHFFWFSEEAITADSLATFLRQEKEKADTKHSSAAWARESGKGLLFYAKRAEDKASPAGLINLVRRTGRRVAATRTNRTTSLTPPPLPKKDYNSRSKLAITNTASRPPLPRSVMDGSSQLKRQSKKQRS